MKEASSICGRATGTGTALVTTAVVDRWRARMVTSAIMEESALSYSMFLTTQAVNAEQYCETLQKFLRAIQNKRHGMLYDNAQPHMAGRSTHRLQEFSQKVFNHPHYSPDIALSDIYIFLQLKKFQSSQRFLNDREAEMSVTQWF